MIEINGKFYEQKEQQGLSRKMSRLLTMAMPYMMMGVGSSKQRERPAVNIPEEYIKILNKESDLSRNDRDWVVSAFKNHYQEVTQEEILQREERRNKLKILIDNHSQEN